MRACVFSRVLCAASVRAQLPCVQRHCDQLHCCAHGTDLSHSNGLCSTADVAYDRTLPVDVYSGAATAPIYIVQGTAGAMQFETLVQPQPAWSAVRLVGTYGFGTLTVSTSADGSCSTILYQFLGRDWILSVLRRRWPSRSCIHFRMPFFALQLLLLSLRELLRLSGLLAQLLQGFTLQIVFRGGANRTVTDQIVLQRAI